MSVIMILIETLHCTVLCKIQTPLVLLTNTRILYKSHRIMLVLFLSTKKSSLVTANFYNIVPSISSMKLEDLRDNLGREICMETRAWRILFCSDAFHIQGLRLTRKSQGNWHRCRRRRRRFSYLT